MKIKRYTAPSMAEAIRSIRDELGPDAVILSTRKIRAENGTPTLEITAAVDDTLPPIATLARERGERRPPEKPTAAPKPSGLREHLIRHGLSDEIREKIDAAVEGMRSTGFSDHDTLEMVLGKMIPFTPPAQALSAGRTHVFIGPAGAGKTTTIAKLAVHKRLDRCSVGMISLDNQRVCGFEQLSSFADALKETAFMVRNSEDWAAATLSLGPKDYLFVDTPGINSFSRNQIADLREKIGFMGEGVQIHLVMPATMNPLEMTYLPAALADLRPSSLIFTRMDEAAYLGGVTNVAAASGLSVCYVSDGTHVPNNIAEIDPATLARKLMTPPQFPWEIRK